MNFVNILCFVITVFHIRYTQAFDQGVPDCGSATNMDLSKRRDALRQHNFKRYFLAGGDPFSGRRMFPTASNMDLMRYDCDLENVAHEIAKGCHNGGSNFDYVGSNNETSNYPYFDFNLITSSVNRWWETGLDGFLDDLIPSKDNSPMIPFLQMANGGTNKLGCAYNICGDENDFNSLAFVLFVCSYGDSHIKVGSEIYTQGEPCDSCKDQCYQGRLCKNEIA